jgi:uncharacterized protein (DUF2147 family)
MKGITAFAVATLVSAMAHADVLSDARGVWLRDDGNARVKIAPCGEKLCATNLWIRDTSKGEEIGDKLIMTLKPNSSSTLEGTAYDPKRKLTFSMTLRVAGKGLTTRGCVIGGVICKNTNWTPTK